MNLKSFIFLLLSSLLCAACASSSAARRVLPALNSPPQSPSLAKAASGKATPGEKLIAAGVEQTSYTKSYDPAYVKLAYPNGDVPKETGVCADVIVRAFRGVSLDLQKEVHEDMARNFSAYPKTWGAKKTDTNIDHRRVGNLMKWFERQNKSLPITKDAKDYAPGDVVAWELDSGRLHIGLVTDIKSDEATKHLVVHNIGAGAQIEDVLFAWKVIGHYRYFQGNSPTVTASGLATSTGNLKIGIIQDEEVYSGGGCTLSLSNPYSDSRPVFFTYGTDEAIMNIDGEDVRLKLVSRQALNRAERKGDKSVEVWQSGNLKVRVDYLITWACYPFREECEGKGFSFDAVMKLTRGNEKKVIKTTGGCGC